MVHLKSEPPRMTAEDITCTMFRLVILEKNYLLVYVYESWNAKLLPHMEVGQQFQPKSIEMVCGRRETLGIFPP